MPKRTRNRYEPPPSTQPRTRPLASFVTSPGVFGVVAADAGWMWWAAWRDGRDHAACLGRDPDGSGWVFAGDLGSQLLGAALSVVFGGDTNAGAVAARDWLRLGGVTRALREDSLAVEAYDRLRPQAPRGAAQTQPSPFRAAPAQPPWWAAELGCPWPPSRADVEAAYRLRVRVTHPDRPGGSAAAFARVQRARECAIGWCAEREGREGER